MKKLVITNAQIHDANGTVEATSLLITDGVITALNPGAVDDATVIDAGGKLLTPALIDLHVHLRDPGQEEKETLETGLRAAVAGGFGTVVSMANTNPTVDQPAHVKDLVVRAGDLGLARLRPAAALSHGLAGKTMTDFKALKEAGAVMITDDGIPVADGLLMRKACEYAAELGLVIQTHSEEPTLRADGVMSEGAVSERLGLPGNPVAAEAIMVFRDAEIARLTGCRVHIAHVSSQRAFEVAEWQRETGAPITIELTPQHLTLTDESLGTYDPVFKVAPPLRTATDVQFLRDALARGAVDSIGTDHAPHTRDEKDRDMLEAPFGIANLEVAFPLLYTELVQTGIISLRELINQLTVGPARVMGWHEPRIKVGEVADLALFDIETVRPVNASTFETKAKFSPWEAQELAGWPALTIIGGDVVWSL